MVAVQEIDPRADDTSPPANAEEPPKTCQPDGTCCCATTIHDEETSSALALPETAICHCNCAHSPASSSAASTASATTEKQTPLVHNHYHQHPPSPPPAPKHQSPLHLHPSITLLSGRPHPRTITRKALEQAQGESAVVVCGPKALNEDVRRGVVALSDERAVCKGSGALGVWFWGEGFGW